MKNITIILTYKCYGYHSFNPYIFEFQQNHTVLTEFSDFINSASPVVSWPMKLRDADAASVLPAG